MGKLPAFEEDLSVEDGGVDRERLKPVGKDPIHGHEHSHRKRFGIRKKPRDQTERGKNLNSSEAKVPVNGFHSNARATKE